jgi:hypothetical protein
MVAAQAEEDQHEVEHAPEVEPGGMMGNVGGLVDESGHQIVR